MRGKLFGTIIVGWAATSGFSPRSDRRRGPARPDIGGRWSSRLVAQEANGCWRSGNCLTKTANLILERPPRGGLSDSGPIGAPRIMLQCRSPVLARSC
jgi:hypothetical protein